MTSRMRKNVGAFAVAVVITIVMGACTGDEADASQGATKLADRTLTPAVTGPTETAPPPLASGAPDVVRQRTCSDGARSRLALTDVGDKIGVRFVVIYAAGDQWRFVLRHGRAGPDPFDYGDGRVFFEGTRDHPPCCSSNLAVHASVGDREGDDGFAAKAVDQQTGQVCKARAVI